MRKALISEGKLHLAAQLESTTLWFRGPENNKGRYFTELAILPFMTIMVTVIAETKWNEKAYRIPPGLTRDNVFGEFEAQAKAVGKFLSRLLRKRCLQQCKVPSPPCRSIEERTSSGSPWTKEAGQTLRTSWRP